MATTLSLVTIPSQPYRLDWTGSDDPSQINDKLSRLWTNADESFQTLFDNLKNAIASINLAINEINALNNKVATPVTIILDDSSGSSNLGGGDSFPGPQGIQGLQGVQGLMGYSGMDGQDGEDASGGAYQIPSTIDTGWTQGSVIFAGPSGRFAQNNGELFWDNSAKTLKINNSGTVTTSIQLGTGSNRLSIVTGTTTTNFDAASLITFFTAAGLSISSSGVVTINNGTGVGGARLKILGLNNEHPVRILGDSTAGQSLGMRINAGTNSSDNCFRLVNQADTIDFLYCRGDGNIGIGLTATTARLHIMGGTAAASTAPLKLTSGTNLTTAEAGAMEYNGTNLFFTRAGTVRENVLVAIDNVSAPTTNIGIAIANYYGSAATNYLGDPNRWLSVNILGTTYKIPLYT